MTNRRRLPNHGYFAQLLVFGLKTKLPLSTVKICFDMSPDYLLSRQHDPIILGSLNIRPEFFY